MRTWTAATITLVVCCGLAASASASMGKLVTVASGQLGEIRWAFAVAGGAGQRCYADSSFSPGPEGLYWEGSSGKVCEEASAPRGEWRHQIGIAFAGGETVELQQTSARVHRLELLLADPTGNSYEPEWRSLHTHALTRGQRIKAKLGPNFRFAAVASTKPFCVTAVKTFDKNGKLLRERSVPCEY